jgi:hypothetical protein
VAVVWEEGTKAINLPPKDYCKKFISWMWDQIGYKPQQSTTTTTTTTTNIPFQSQNKTSKKNKISKNLKQTIEDNDDVVVPGNFIHFSNKNNHSEFIN